MARKKKTRKTGRKPRLIDESFEVLTRAKLRCRKIKDIRESESCNATVSELMLLWEGCVKTKSRTDRRGCYKALTFVK